MPWLGSDLTGENCFRAGAATLLVSLGSTHLFSLRRVKLRGGSLLGNKSIDPSCVNIADRILQIIVR